MPFVIGDIMKKSYKRLVLFAFIFILLFLLNSFVFKILSQPLLNGIVIFLIIISYFLFGFEKDRHRYTKDIILEIIIILISIFLLYYLLGILVGFAKTANYLTIKSIVKIIIPLIIYIVLMIIKILHFWLYCMLYRMVFL